MLSVQLLGRFEISGGSGSDFESLLSKPKLAALLAYLTLPRPGTWHRRDSLIAIFWPDTDQTRARSSLRSGLLVIRRHLPDGAIMARGDEELSVAPDLVTTDVAEMQDDIAGGQFDRALKRFSGDLLPGVFLADAPEFDHWIEQERLRVRRAALTAATQLSEHREQRGDLVGAIEAARRASELLPESEAHVRRWITLLDRAGDRAQAFGVYDRFRTHLDKTLGVRPSAETVALLDAIRTRRIPPAVVESADVPAVTVPESVVVPNPTHSRDAPRRTGRRMAWAAVATAAMIVLVVKVLRPQRDEHPASGARDLVILPMENVTGDSAIAYVASGMTEGIAQRLDRLGSLRIVSGARAQWPTTTAQDLRTIAREFGRSQLLRSKLERVGDSLQVSVASVNAETLEEQRVSSRAFSLHSIRLAESNLAADVAGALFRIPMPTFPRSPDGEAQAQSYALTLEGWHRFFLGQRSRAPIPGRDRFLRAQALFDSALAIDPRNARAYSGLSTVWGNQAVVDLVPFAEGYELSVAAAEKALALDSLQGSAWANLAIMRALKFRDLKQGLDLIRKAELSEPSNPEIYLIKGTILRSAQQYGEAIFADQIAKRLDPLNPNMRVLEGESELCADRPDAALRVLQIEAELHPDNIRVRRALTRTLATLGRYDEAIASWRSEAVSSRDSLLENALRSAKGKDGYWAVRHADGRRRLAQLRRQAGWVSPLRVVQSAFAAGEEEAGYDAIEHALAVGTPALYRLRCMPDIDEFRHSPRFANALARIGGIR
jgi:DNA-binding SARP family transcriptional activator/TolB-like protein